MASRLPEQRAIAHDTAGSGIRRADQQPVSIFSSLRVRNYRLYFSGQMVSVVGNWAQNVAVGWEVLQLTHSGTVLGVITGARYAPLLVLGPWGGLIADRIPNRPLIIVTQSLASVLSLLIAILSSLDSLTVWTLLIIVLSLGVVDVFDGPSRQSLISQVVDRVYLANAIGWNSTGVNLARIAGPAVAGALIATLGITWCFYINAVSFAPLIVNMLLMRGAGNERREKKAKGQITAGVRYIINDHTLRCALLMVIVTGVFTSEFPTTLPLLTSHTFGRAAGGYAAAMSSMSIGGAIGGLVAARRLRLSVRSVAVSALLWGVAIVAASLAPNYISVLALLIVVGSGSISFNAAAKTLIQLHSREEMRGRVISMWSIAWQGGGVVGAPLVGAIATRFGARYGLLLGGLAAVAIGAAMLLPWAASGQAVEADPMTEAPAISLD